MASKTWLECTVSFRNIRAKQAREHPLFILDALCKYAANGSWPLWLFRPHAHYTAPIAQDSVYTITLIFPESPTSLGNSVVSSLMDWLKHPWTNFQIEEAASPSLQCAADFFDQNTLSESQALTLQILSPLPYKAETGWKGTITPTWFSTQLLRRMERLFGPAPEECSAEIGERWQGVRLYPWFLSYEEHHHKARSTQGVRYLNGFTGDATLEAPCGKTLTDILPLLALGSKLNVGSRLSAGQGAFRLLPYTAQFDALLFSQEPPTPSLLHTVLGPPLKKADPASELLWQKTLPAMPEDPAFFAAALACVPTCNQRTHAYLRYLQNKTSQNPHCTTVASDEAVEGGKKI